MDLLLLLLLGDDALLVLGKSPSDGAGLLGAEVERQVLLALVEDAELRTLVDVDDGKNTGDRLADVVAVKRKPSELDLSRVCVVCGFPPPTCFSSSSDNPIFLFKRTFCSTWKNRCRQSSECGVGPARS